MAILLCEQLCVSIWEIKNRNKAVLCFLFAVLLGGIAILRFSEKCVDLDTSSTYKFMISLVVLTITAPIRLVCEVASKIMLTTRDVILKVLLVATIMNGVLSVALIIADRFPLRWINVPLPVAFGSLILSGILLVSFLTVKNSIFTDELNIHALMMDADYEEYDDAWSEDVVEDVEDIEDIEGAVDAGVVESVEAEDDAFAVFDNMETEKSDAEVMDLDFQSSAPDIDLSDLFEED